MTEGDSAAEARVKVVYCGGCNPHIDRESVADGLWHADPEIPPGATVHLSGCQRACASGHQLAAEGGGQAGAHAEGASTGAGAEGAPAAADRPRVVVVAGELVDGVPTPAADLVPAVTRKLKE